MAGRLIDHRLEKGLKAYQESIDQRLLTSKSAFDERLAVVTAEVESALRRQVDAELGDLAGERQYRLDARKRLYGAIGPLRFQLIIACADLSNRVDRIGRGSQRYGTTLDGYFGRSTVFRLLRVFAITELVERQVSQADFSVDPSTVALLRFKQTAFRCMASSTLTLDHPRANWKRQVEHVYHDTLSIIAATTIVTDPASAPGRAMRFDEFNKFAMNRESRKSIAPIPQLFEKFSPSTKPILWLRLVALGRVCSAFVEREGPQVGIQPERYDVSLMLAASGDEHILARVGDYGRLFENLVADSRPLPVPREEPVLATSASAESQKTLGSPDGDPAGEPPPNAGGEPPADRDAGRDAVAEVMEEVERNGSQR